MKRWRWHRIRALLLALLLGLSMSVAVSHASSMSAEMAIVAGGAEPGSKSCDACNGDDLSAGLGTCLSVCGSAGHGLVPDGPAALPPFHKADPSPAHRQAGGHTSHPDHGPPKALTLV
jgi:hypothetical protein